jgi:predicted  nucleic acid-binding Zn-ribbon protein
MSLLDRGRYCIVFDYAVTIGNMGAVFKLLALQQLESEIESLQKASSQARSRLGESPELKQARANMQREQARQEQLAGDLKKLEWQAEDLKSKLENVNRQLYGGSIKNPKELTVLLHEGQLLSGQLATVDEEALAVMEALEAGSGELSRLQEALKQVEASWREQQHQLTLEIQAANERLNMLEKEHSVLVAEILPEEMQMYQRIKIQRGFAVARVAQGTCEGCRISLSSAQLQRSRGGSLERCANCGRILCNE